MINRLQLIRNIGQFDSVAPAANLRLSRLTLVYAENGRGKTTLAAILRSLATGDPLPIAERRRLAAQHAPNAVVECTGGPPPAIFQNNSWNRTFANMVIFDDVFVDTNVCSGLAVGADHRQHLHELILGALGVALNQQLQRLVDRVEAHNTALRNKAAAIPAAARPNLSVDAFCALPNRANIDADIQTAERALAAARAQDPVRTTPIFEPLNLPPFDIANIERVLQQDLPTLDIAAVTRVQQHLESIGRGGEEWVSDGMARVPQPRAPAGFTACPFCAQDLTDSPVLPHYRAYFSQAYSTLKKDISRVIGDTSAAHSEAVVAAFERSVRVTSEQRQFWSRFCDVPDLNLDTALIARDWTAARDAVIAVLRKKQGTPLEPAALDAEVRAALETYQRHRDTVAGLNQLFQATNPAIRVTKEKAAGANLVALTADLARLAATRARHTQPVATLCDEYLAEQAAKSGTEQQRDQTRDALDQYRRNAFPGYQTAINQYLQRFNAGFRLDSITSANTRSGPTCTYNVLINNTPVAVSGGEPAVGEPSFRNTMSSGDRNTLALAFFFASLDQDPARAAKVVVIDDPISSLDDHRSLTTVQEVRRLAQETSQVLVLSHSKVFLCRLWEGADRIDRSSMQVARDGAGSTIATWDVEQDCVTEHDRRHAVLRDYLANGNGNTREVARSIRPLLEAFLRVALPEHFPPGTLLGPFRNICEQRLLAGQPILPHDELRELRDVVEYSNRFHHETNLAWETERINDGELRGFVERALRFARK